MHVQDENCSLKLKQVKNKNFSIDVRSIYYFLDVIKLHLFVILGFWYKDDLLGVRLHTEM